MAGSGQGRQGPLLRGPLPAPTGESAWLIQILMPELPEVETLVRRLREVLPGRCVERAEVRRANVVRGPVEAFVGEVEGSLVERVERRGKYLVFGLGGDRVWWSHLRMSGKWRVDPDGTAPLPEYARAVFELDDGARLVFQDVRTLGEMEVVSAERWAERSDALGPEPLEEAFTADVLLARLKRSRRVVKELLLDQSVVAGLGNIYVVEALWRARVSPRRRGINIGPRRARRLHRAIVDVLTEAVGQAGTSLGGTYLNWADDEGERGRFRAFLSVYGREGEPCSRCGAEIRRVVQAQRSSWYCPDCQR